ncbi:MULTISPECIES: hypothetical protein [unclassified Mycoplasma]|uniref:hypothetical protein n=1 Tax=unclassified Mycoplasma TaxID=2683645 RepID=UPI002B1D4327|nr:MULTISPECIES: hypothetical protein [unclassified Mycoplasma]MEA4162685.1 hypothetical protein [Mycoplasma sp. 4404]MEA4276324.1 hypothetical protein [Mycoplasma sp. 21DD0573]
MRENYNIWEKVDVEPAFKLKSFNLVSDDYAVHIKDKVKNEIDFLSANLKSTFLKDIEIDYDSALNNFILNRNKIQYKISTTIKEIKSYYDELPDEPNKMSTFESFEHRKLDILLNYLKNAKPNILSIHKTNHLASVSSDTNKKLSSLMNDIKPINSKFKINWNEFKKFSKEYDISFHNDVAKFNKSTIQNKFDQFWFTHLLMSTFNHKNLNAVFDFDKSSDPILNFIELADKFINLWELNYNFEKYAVANKYNDDRIFIPKITSYYDEVPPVKISDFDKHIQDRIENSDFLIQIPVVNNHNHELDEILNGMFSKFNNHDSSYWDYVYNNIIHPRYVNYAYSSSKNYEVERYYFYINSAYYFKNKNTKQNDSPIWVINSLTSSRDKNTSFPEDKYWLMSQNEINGNNKNNHSLFYDAIIKDDIEILNTYQNSNNHNDAKKWFKPTEDILVWFDPLKGVDEWYEFSSRNKDNNFYIINKYNNRVYLNPKGNLYSNETSQIIFDGLTINQWLGLENLDKIDENKIPIEYAKYLEKFKSIFNKVEYRKNDTWTKVYELITLFGHESEYLKESGLEGFKTKIRNADYSILGDNYNISYSFDASELDKIAKYINKDELLSAYLNKIDYIVNKLKEIKNEILSWSETDDSKFKKHLRNYLNILHKYDNSKQNNDKYDVLINSKILSQINDTVEFINQLLMNLKIN